MIRFWFFALSCLFTISCIAQPSTEDFPDHVVGDIGGMIYSSNLHIGTEGMQSLVLPYVFADYERVFARIDEVGIKTFKMGYGHFEIIGKISLDSYRIKSPINGYSINKNDPIPLGFGTLQETPLGGIFVNVYHDFGLSKGMLYELLYFGEIETLNKIVIYPQVGLERQSSQFSNYYYGITPNQSASTGYPTYSAAASNNPMLGLMVEIPVVDDWYLNLYGKRKWLGNGINNSPVMTRSFQDSAFLSIAYRFK